MNEDKKKILRNHIPTAQRYLSTVLTCLDVDNDDVKEAAYLIELLKEARANINSAITVIQE